MIVNVTRPDLREEFSMAEEAFALSPISARAAQPSEEDYAAISEAFMETARGRWFLGEYAKRNRNAGRICDLIDSQVAVIEAGAGTISSEQAKAALNAAFASLESRLAELGNDAAPAPVAEAETAEAIAAEAAMSETAAASPSPAI